MFKRAGGGGLTLPSILKMSEAELARQDIAAVHLACARGLPGAEDLNVSRCLERLEEWTDLVRLGISRALANRRCFPELDEFSSAEYQILTMFSVLYRHLGLTPHVAFNEEPYDGSDSRDLFIHAVLMDGYPATCCTAPVIFAAIGRRLGFPIKLVMTREHYFCRWDDGDERFNIEATNRGYYRYEDDHYLTWPKPIHGTHFERALRYGVLLRNLLPHQELAMFLAHRGVCLLENLRVGESLKAFCFASRLALQNPFHRGIWRQATLIHRALQESKTCADLEFPPRGIDIPPPRKDWERLARPYARETLFRIIANLRNRSSAALRGATSEEIVTPR